MTRTAKIIAAGFLLRAFAGQALFWISYLHLPIAPSLQLGDGFWFFAADGPEYLRLAHAAAEEGLPGFVSLGPLVPSRLFIRLLTILVAACGPLASLAILINCAAYALTCALLVRMRASDVLLAAIAFSPAALLFSTQLLKDTLFFFLIVLTAAVFQRWQELWRRGGALRSFIACAAAMLAVVYALAGIRWYFAAIVWTSSAVFLVLATATARRRGAALASNALLFVLLAQCVRLGGLDMPPQIARILNPATAFQSQPSAVTDFVGRGRRGFDRTPGATTIAPGPAVAAAIPNARAARCIAGLSATFLPRFVGQSLGLIEVGGGRGLWFFAEADTIVFDLVLLYVVIHCVQALRSGSARATPLFAALLYVFVFTAGPLIYSVSNFGTLFRLRQMLYVIAVVTAVTTRPRGHEENAVRAGERCEGEDVDEEGPGPR